MPIMSAYGTLYDQTFSQATTYEKATSGRTHLLRQPHQPRTHIPMQIQHSLLIISRRGIGISTALIRPGAPEHRQDGGEGWFIRVAGRGWVERHMQHGRRVDETVDGGVVISTYKGISTLCH